MKIYYFNINYSCNNHCKFCFSHNTFFKTERNIEPRAIKEVIERYDIKTQDRIIINGGEPTLHPYFKEILDDMFKTGAEIVLYSNGRLIQNDMLCSYVLQRINRVVIPIHGNQAVHDAITQVKGSFSETEQAITQIAKSQYKSKLELKFIVNDLMLKSNFSILDFLKKRSVLNNHVVISGLVKTKVAQLNTIIIPNENDAGEYVVNTISQILPFVGGIKLIDFPLCTLPDTFLSFLNSLNDTTNKITFTYYFVDGNYPQGRIMEYNRQKTYYKCNGCSIKKYCTSVLDSCLVLEFNTTDKKIVLE